MEKWRLKKHLILAAKIAIGSSMAIYIAQCMDLEYSVSAGTISLLTLMTTKWKTMKLSLFRLITFILTTVLAFFIFTYLESMWLTYGILIFFVTLFSDIMGWRASISVNSVIAVHLLTSGDFSFGSIYNEFVLLIIGITIAIILNLFNDNSNHKKEIISKIRYTEDKLQTALYGLSKYLLNEETGKNALKNIMSIKENLREFIKEAYEFQENTFHSHPAYYIDYFVMRLNQCRVLYNIYFEIQGIVPMPERQSKIISDYIMYLSYYVVEINVPNAQLEKLNKIFEAMKMEVLPKTREEFESRAILYHLLKDIEKFLIFKLNFVEGLSVRQRKEYWNN